MPNRRHKRYARSILIQMAVVTIAVLALVLWQWPFLTSLYGRAGATAAGYIVNGMIGVLFAVGVFALLRMLLRYAEEEAALDLYESNIGFGIHNLEGVAADSIIAQRHMQMIELYRRRAPIDHGALAASLVARESVSMGAPRFINNVLILTGVLGTIVSLSIALLGAADMIGENAGDAGLGMVIGGMSTALSTTMTAIVAYLIFGYFFLRTLDVQTQYLGRIEQLTTTELLPRYQSDAGAMVSDYSRLLKTGADLLERMDSAHREFSRITGSLERLVADLGRRTDSNSQFAGELQTLIGRQITENARSSREIHELLREGFRLPSQQLPAQQPPTSQLAPPKRAPRPLR